MATSDIPINLLISGQPATGDDFIFYSYNNTDSRRASLSTILGKLSALKSFSSTGIVSHDSASGFRRLTLDEGLSLSSTSTETKLSLSNIPYSSLGNIQGASILGNPTGGSVGPIQQMGASPGTVLKGKASGENTNIAWEKIESADIADNTIETSKIKDKNITFAKISDVNGLSVIGNSGTTSNTVGEITSVNDGEVLRRSGNTIGFGQINGGAISASAITSDKISDGAITADKIADGAINSSDKLANNIISGTKIMDGAVGVGKLAANAVANSNILNGAVYGSKIADGGVNSAKLAAGAVLTEKIANGAVTEEKLATGIIGGTSVQKTYFEAIPFTTNVFLGTLGKILVPYLFGNSIYITEFSAGVLDWDSSWTAEFIIQLKSSRPSFIQVNLGINSADRYERAVPSSGNRVYYGDILEILCLGPSGAVSGARGLGVWITFSKTNAPVG